MKVLVCAYTCSPTGEGERFGGGEDILGWNIVRQIARFHLVTVIAHERNKLSVEKFLTNAPHVNLHFHYFSLPNWLSWLQRIQGGIQFYAFLWQILAYFEAKRLNDLHRFDFFHHVTYANDWMASYIGALLPAHYIRGPCGGAHRTPKSFLSQYGFKGRLWERIRIIGQFLFRHDPFFLKGQGKAEAILLCNNEAISALPDKWQYKSHLLAVCGVSSNDLNISRYTENENSVFKVITAGKLLPLKGFKLAVQAFAEFSRKHPDVELTIVGEGPELDNLKHLVYEEQVGDQVKFQAWLPRDELLYSMASSDVFLFCSLRDGGGAVVVEAMSQKCPVVCLDISGPGMHVTNETGIKIQPTTPERSIIEIAAALEKLYLEPELRKSMGNASRERTELIYHWDRVGDRLYQIYNQIANEKSSI